MALRCLLRGHDWRTEHAGMGLSWQVCGRCGASRVQTWGGPRD